MNREVFCSSSMGSAVPLSYDLPSLPPFHSTFLFSFSISPLFILQQLSILLPCDSLLLALYRICFFSHLWRPPTHLFKKAFSQIPTHALWSWGTHTCTCSDCPLIFPIQQLASHHLLGCSQMHRWRKNLNKLFSNGAAGPRFLFKYWWPQKEGWEECDGKISHFQSINAIACM